MTDAELYQSFDAQVWAKQFIEHVKANPDIPLDEACMTTWFASALMRGYDEQYWKSKEYKRSVRRALYPWWNRLFIPLACLVLLTSCGGSAVQPSTPAPPNSPQSTVALTVNTIADSDQTAVKSVIFLRDSGKISQATTATIENWLALVATTDKQVSAILAKPETWAKQKVEIYTLLATVTAPAIATNVDPGATAVIAQVQTLINQLKTLVVP